MKRFLIASLVIVCALSFTGCSKKGDTSFSIPASEVAKTVYDWKLYTNPAYRYELRFPKDWAVFDSGEDGKQSAFYPIGHGEELKQKDKTYYGSMIILATSNWQTKYTLEDFYRQKTENLFLGNYEQEKIALNGNEAIWFKDVRNRNIEKPDAVIDVIAIDLSDRILEIEIPEKEYYPNASPAGMN